MISASEVLVRAGRLVAEGQACALATVVRVERPASTKPGDRALVMPDGTLSGWVGGACSEPIVVREALRALADGETRLLTLGPAETSCASEGTVEVLVEPQLPAPLLAVVGESPAAAMLDRLASAVGWRVVRELAPEPDAVVVATMGQADEASLEAALATPAGYVGLVASARRAGVVLAELRGRGLGEDTLTRVRSPAGLDLGPSTQDEIAVAVLAELVAWRHSRGGNSIETAEAVDPVCGMSVAARPSSESLRHEGATYYFCSAGCRARFEEDLRASGPPHAARS
jgi:xanthine dehydrogenase accessory factor